MATTATVPASSIPYVNPSDQMKQMLAPDVKGFDPELRVKIVKSGSNLKIQFKGPDKKTGLMVDKKMPSIMVLAQLRYPPSLTGNQTGALGAGDFPTDNVNNTNFSLTLRPVDLVINKDFADLREKINRAIAKFIGDGGLKDMAEDNSKFGMPEEDIFNKLMFTEDKTLSGMKSNPSVKTPALGFGPDFFSPEDKANRKKMQNVQQHRMKFRHCRRLQNPWMFGISVRCKHCSHKQCVLT